MSKWCKYLIPGFFILMTTFVQAKVTLPQFFSSNMVLQRDMPVHAWGWADRNESVKINFNGFTKKVKTGKTGKWSLQFPAMHYGGPYIMTVNGKENTLVFENILIGDVWLCSGQSNMEIPLEVENTGKNEIKVSENKNIRLFKVPRSIQTRERDDIMASNWMECNPATSPGFSAVAYFFGKNLNKELEVPIGLIEDVFGGTGIQTWTSWEASVKSDEFAKYKGETIEKVFGHPGEEMNNILNALWVNKDDGMINKWFLPIADKTGWKTMYAPKAWDGELKDDDGVVWFRKEITLPSELEGKPGKLHIGIGGNDRLYLNGSFIDNPTYIDDLNFDVNVKAGINLIAVRFLDMGGEGGYRRRVPEEFFLEVDGKKYPLTGDWEYKPSLLLSKLKLKTLYLPGNFASLLYNGMIHPLIKLPIKGVIWYQGEGNLGEAFKYKTLFPEMITDWRKQWGYDFPFLWVQLPGFQRESVQPEESDWAELREAQNMALKLPNTGQAVITDIGDANDVHPKNKKDVGYRLAQNALRIAYGKQISGSGPVYETMEINGNKITIRFSNTGSGLLTKEKNKYGYLYGFSVAGTDKKFVWAKAFIQGNNVLVYSDKVANPVAVRYGWASNPKEINIVNSDGLLASPFRTDTWKGITEH